MNSRDIWDSMDYGERRKIADRFRGVGIEVHLQYEKQSGAAQKAIVSSVWNGKPNPGRVSVQVRPIKSRRVGSETTIGDLWDYILSKEEKENILNRFHIKLEDSENPEIIRGKNKNVVFIEGWGRISKVKRTKMLPELAVILCDKKEKAGLPPPKKCAECEILFSDEFPEWHSTGVCMQCWNGILYDENRDVEMQGKSFMEALEGEDGFRD